jgi:ATP-dependent DNA helicase DinG
VKPAAGRPTQATPDAVAQARQQVADAFAIDGPLARNIARFAARPSQVEMAQAVFDSIVERGTLVAEAGTGTGKTFAYLVPALLAGGKLLVSTGTKALQDQVCTHDLRTLLRALDLPLTVAVLKGRQNYLCLHRLARTEREGLLASRQDVVHLRAITRFAQLTSSGDRAELTDVPEGASIWPAVTSTRENCLGQECERFDECFVYRARRAAQAADVVVVNHHLFLADLALRDDAIREFLPAVDTVVLDEAHQLPKIAGDFFAAGWSLAQALDLAQDARAAGLAQARDAAAWVALTQTVEQAARSLRLDLAEAGLLPGSRLALERMPGAARLAAALAPLGKALTALRVALAGTEGREPELDALAARAGTLLAQVEGWRNRLADAREIDASSADVEPRVTNADEEEVVRWIGLTQAGAQFTATPLAPGEAFARVREQQPQAWILVSATLTLAQRFEPFLQELGLRDATTRRWDSPFDFARQGLLYLPNPMPSPLASDFAEQVARAALPVIAAAGGRTFVLCATLRAVDRVSAELTSLMRGAGLELPLLVQGTAPRPALLEAFRRHGNAVLVGSVSFWEGIDVRGEALSVVIIDKLPFAPPDDPIIDARSRRLRRLGRNPFTDYQLPLAVTLLKQGVGRLIRDEVDRGVLVILDDRVLAKSYGKTVLASLPPFTRTRRLADVQAFFGAAAQAA